MGSAKRLIDAERAFVLKVLESVEARISKRFDEIEGRISRLETAATVTPRYPYTMHFTAYDEGGITTPPVEPVYLEELKCPQKTEHNEPR